LTLARFWCLGEDDMTAMSAFRSLLRGGCLLAALTACPCRSSCALADDPSPWFAFDPPADSFAANCPLDLRRLNEQFAGEGGFIAAKDGQFVHSATGQSVRFWAVNGPPEDLRGAELRRCARLLAKYGVNLVRVHTAMFDKDGEPDAAKVKRAQEIVAAMKAEGVYTHFSIYFPLWFTPRSDLSWLEGYDGKQHPFAALMFNRKFQEKHRAWLAALLTTPDEATQKPLLADPAVFGVEIQNEDSFFFWTFAEKNIPAAQLQIIEKQFGDWLIKKYGSLERAFAAWNKQSVARDAFAERRAGFRPLWNVFNERTPRDLDTVAFLLEKQTQFYEQTRDFLRQLGFQGLITASNWYTASPERFGPLEKLSYLAGDFVDRHGYFECGHQGDNAAWSIRNGHTYSDRSALRFDAAEPGKPKQFVHPVMDPHYADKPSMISETTFTRPNRFRSEAPLYFAAYGALQDSDCIVHFALDGARWQVKPRFWMQQWTLATPSMLGQFPAAALLYRRGLVAAGDVLADLTLNKDELLHLQGTPLPQDASFDELRLKDVPPGALVKPNQRLDPLLHFAGRTQVTFADTPASAKLVDAARYINRQAQTVVSTSGELKLDYGKGLLLINAPRAQGASGALSAAGKLELPALAIECDLDLAHIIAVSLDDEPLAKSKRILLQVNSEEQATGFATEAAGPVTKRITNIGRDPWQIKRLSGRVTFRRPEATEFKVLPLDFNGYPSADIGATDGISIRLLPTTLYYLITCN
jgi:hypothetical protein